MNTIESGFPNHRAGSLGKESVVIKKGKKDNLSEQVEGNYELERRQLIGLAERELKEAKITDEELDDLKRSVRNFRDSQVEH